MCVCECACSIFCAFWDGLHKVVMLVKDGLIWVIDGFWYLWMKCVYEMVKINSNLTRTRRLLLLHNASLSICRYFRLNKN